MDEMLTAKELQAMLQVDRSTIYRMADRGDLPAVKVGKLWRFPRESVKKWLGAHKLAATEPTVRPESFAGTFEDFDSLLPLKCVQLIQDTFSELLGVMLVIADLDGEPLTAVNNPTPLYKLLSNTVTGQAICREKWRELGQAPALTPHFEPGFGGLLCARAFVRVGNELTAMVIAFGVAPHDWSLSRPELEQLAPAISTNPDTLQEALRSAPRLGKAERQRVYDALQRLTDILAHIAEERRQIIGRLREIGRFSTL